jgi:hypothetical protein
MNLIFLYDALLYFTGHMNTKQLSKENLQIMHTVPLPDVKVGIWFARRIMGPVSYI